MDLQPSDDQQAIIDLADQIVGDLSTPDALRALERAGHRHHAELWRALAEADLLGLTLPEDAGGAGYGLCEAAMVAEVVGAHVAPVPFVEVVAAGRALGRAGDELARQVTAGTVVVPALREGPDAAETTSPATTALGHGTATTLTGTKRLVAGAAAADAYLVSARHDTTVDLFVVDAGAVASATDSAGMTGQPYRSIELDATPARPVDGGDDDLAALLHELRVLRCAHLAGVAQGALTLAAEHCKQREQFGSPIGTFQAVAHRLADSWLDVNLIRATARQAAWRSDNDLPAVQAAASAALWACEGVQRVVHAAQHVHGGVGVDLDYPVHRYFRWAKDVELQLGGASICVRDLGAAIAAEPLTIG